MADDSVTIRKPSFGKRFHAWWEGYELPPPAMEPEDDVLLLTDRAPDQDWTEMPDDPGKLWSRGRIEAAEIIFGQNYVGPGGTDFTLNLAKPFGLSPTVSLLELSAGLGGGTRALAQTFGVWVTGQESDPDLAQEGDDRSVKADLMKKAPVRHYDPERLELKAKSFDCVFARELFWRVHGKKELFQSIARALKDRGQLIFTDFLRAEDGRTTAAVDAWASSELQPPALSTLTETMNAMLDNRLDCRIDEDISDDFRRELMAAWMNLVNRLQAKSVPKHVLREVLYEAERWARFGTALDSGELRVYRFHAFK